MERLEINGKDHKDRLEMKDIETRESLEMNSRDPQGDPGDER
jgi:hypothetical protein